MVQGLDDSNEEVVEDFFLTSAHEINSEESVIVNKYLNSIANAKMAVKVDKQIADQLHTEASSFRGKCIQSIEDMKEAHLKKMREKKGIKESSNDHEISEQEVIKYFAFERKHSLNGWFLAPYDPNQLVDIFQCLHLKKGYHLEAYQGVGKSGNGSSFVFVVPDNRTLPKRAPEKALYDLLIMSTYGESDDALNWRSMLKKVFHYLIGIAFPSYRSLPKWADMVVENYIEGDGSPLSYFQMSMFLREMAELGSIWHCASWSHHVLISAAEQLQQKEWTWYQPEPVEWRPLVWMDEDQRWNVTFYTHNEKDADLIFHNDTFVKGHNELETFSKSIAYYPGGYMV